MSEPVLRDPRLEAPAHRVEISRVAPPADGRLQSLDVFRGITIAGMLLVNNPGTWSAVYPPLRHAEWHGWTPTDLIFPFFLFIVGVAMTYSFGKLIDRGQARTAILVKSAKRAAILFGLGLILHSYPWIGFDYGHLRIPGVLQRIALAFLAAAVLVLWLGPRGRAAAAATLLLGYWALLSWVPVPGGQAGVLEPGQDLGAYIDRAVFGIDHLYANSRTWDPEGLLSTLPAIVTVLLGVFAGEWLRSGRNREVITRGLFLAGVVGVVAGMAWNSVFPINKGLWTSSYVLFTAGAGAILLAACYWVIDVKGSRRWAFPFLVLGMNAIAAYFLSSLMAEVIDTPWIPGPDGAIGIKPWVYQNVFASWLTPVNASLAFALTFVIFWVLVMWGFYRRRIFVKV